jgi:hypothetical protein
MKMARMGRVYAMRTTSGAIVTTHAVARAADRAHPTVATVQFCAEMPGMRLPRPPLLLVPALLAACGGQPARPACPPEAPVYDLAHGCVAPALSEPSPLAYEAIIVTDAAYVEAFARLARLHTLTGVPTEVVAHQAICAVRPGGCSDADACGDTAKAIKDYLILRRATGLRHVLLGGDLSIVPSRQTHDLYTSLWLGVAYQETFYADHYFGDLSEWDGNGDCVYGDPATDEPDYLPDIAVSRVAVSSPAQLETYIGKVESYLTAYDVTRIPTALFLSNVATEVSLPFSEAPVPVDSALYFEAQGRTLSLLPSGFAVTKLYSSLVDAPDARPLTVADEAAALQAGANLVVHAGHGSVSDLTVETDGGNAFSGAMAYALDNRQLPIMLSCACRAATFAAETPSAGQQLITAPHGGGIGYLGNSTVGLGMGGGMQLIDELLRHAFATPGEPIDDALLAARANLPRTDDFLFSGMPVVGSMSVPVVDANSWRWTQKAATYLGDGLVPIYTNPALGPAPTFVVAHRRMGAFTEVTLRPTAPVRGKLAIALEGNVYQVELRGDGGPASVTVHGRPALVAYGFSSPATLAAYGEVALP